VQIILNADDLGRSPGINAAIIRAHREGVLTSASLMVSAPAWADAVALARQTPDLAVGLHVVVAGGSSVLPHRLIPHLVDASGRFPDDSLGPGLRYFFSPTAQREIADELEAQFERFAATGFDLDHVDGHLHLHVHPTIFRLLLPLASAHGAHGLRLPRDPFWPAIRYDRARVGTKAGWALAFSWLCRLCVRYLVGTSLKVTQRVYGLMQTGQMTEAYLLSVLRALCAPSAEIYFHPSSESEVERLGPNPGDLAALLSPAVRDEIALRRLRPVTYRTLGPE